MRYIDLDYFLNYVKDNAPYIYTMVAIIAETMPKYEKIQCKDCKYRNIDAFNRTVCERNFNIIEIKDTDFCSYGERRDT